MLYRGETIWIIGASSGIGAHLARTLSDQGAKLILSARSEDKLKELNRELGEEHLVIPLDVSNLEAVKQAASVLMERGVSLDRTIFMAGVYEPGNIMDVSAEKARMIMDVNFMGAFYVTQAVMPLFEKQGHGQIALCASVAAYTGLPGGQTYSASKAALRNFTESLRAETPKNIDVKLISPGFVRTPLTDKNTFKMPMMIEPEDAAAHIAKGLKSKSFEIHFPKGFTFLIKMMSALPYILKLPLLNKMNEKR